jgi:type VI secretion system protein ImpF
MRAMAELTQKERLQPSLLDRLTDTEPDKKQEARDKRVLSLSKLRESVIRDLAWLFNSANFESTEDLSDYPHVARSVVNFGLPDLSGKAVSSLDVKVIEKLLKQIIQDFEPRILGNSLHVSVSSDESAMSSNALTFDIEGEMWSQPTPQRLFLRTEIDLESGGFEVREKIGRG